MAQTEPEIQQEITIRMLVVLPHVKKMIEAASQEQLSVG